ncbi:hypothetical protein MCHI_000687 [Candidatus Magnetoovum chiemensis]|nr:hypothetical protein MCHI_000687 [Candidatus Magnetoovum chiemensis]
MMMLQKHQLLKFLYSAHSQFYTHKIFWKHSCSQFFLLLFVGYFDNQALRYHLGLQVNSHSMLF